jgi:Fe2+ or Zn2+ uptake regulation protein
VTVAPDAPRLEFEDLEDAARALRERGLRLSSPRRLVLEALWSAEGPVSAERIAAGLGLDPASVYRNLVTLERIGIARHVHLGHGPGLYVLVGGGDREYLYCERCGAVRTLTPEQLEPVRDQIRALFGYSARFSHHAIVGLCAACAAEGSAPRRRRGRPRRPREHSHGAYVHSHDHPGHAGLDDRHRHEH